MSITAMKLALEALEVYWVKADHLRTKTDDWLAEEARNALRQAIEQAEQEQPVPVVCTHKWFRTGAMKPGEARCIDCGAWNNTPPQRKPLTDEEIKKMSAPLFMTHYWNLCNIFARAIEAAHGIKENT